MPTASNKGTRINYDVRGEGPPLILLHGTSGSIQDWYEAGYVDGLSDAYRLVMIDQRGHGASDRPHDVSEYEWPLLVDDVSCVLDQLGIQAASMFGYSAGSYVAMGMAMTIPDRVSRLILGGASPKWAGLRPQTGELLATEGMEGFVRVFFEANGPLPTAQRNKLLANDPLALRASLSASRCTPSPEMLQAFTKPCLLLVGEADPRLADSREMASQFANAQLVTFPELNHVQTFERGDLVVPHLKAFLANS